jgi:hypothetical protein
MDFEQQLSAVFLAPVPVSRETGDDREAIWVDFDGTLAQGPSADDPFDQPPREDVTQELLRWKEQKPNLDIIIFTARPWDDLHKIKEWLDSSSFPYTTIVCGKPRTYACIDDLSVNPRFAGWRSHLEKLLRDRPSSHTKENEE